MRLASAVAPQLLWEGHLVVADLDPLLAEPGHDFPDRHFGVLPNTSPIAAALLILPVFDLATVVSSDDGGVPRACERHYKTMERWRSWFVVAQRFIETKGNRLKRNAINTPR